MKKQILLFMMTLLSVIARADSSGTCGAKLTWIYEDATRTLTISGTGEMTNFANASSSPWRSMYYKINNIIINKGVTSIGDYAFTDCSLTTVTIPEGITYIGKQSFQSCYDLKSLTIPSTVTSFGKDAFISCSGLTTLTISEGVTSIGERTFSGCKGLLSITIPSTVTSIGSNAFSSCEKLTSITIPSSVTNIGQGAFEGCHELVSILVDDNNSVYDSRENCNAIIRTEDNTLIAGCDNTIIPTSVTAIGDYAFSGFWNLVSLTIPSSVTKIGICSFKNCFKLKSMNFPSSISWIGKEAFYCCAELSSVTFSSSAYIGDNAFYLCTNLTSVHINDLSVWCKIGFSNSFSNPLYYAHHLFLNEEEVTNLVIPLSVTYISNYAFYGCTSIRLLIIPSSVTSISYYSFANCTSLASVIIPSSVTFISNGAFIGCSGLSDVYCYSEPVPNTSNDAFNNSSISNATLHVPNSTIDNYKTSAPWSSFGNIVVVEENILGLCATPTINYANGKVRFACETEGVVYVPMVTVSPNQQLTSDELEIGGTFTVSVYAMKEGYFNSDIATMTINMSQMGDVNADGELNAADITAVVNAILGK